MFDVCDRRFIARIGKGIENDQRIVGMAIGPIVNEITTNEARASGYENVSQVPFPVSA
jgi:hypothetical protein